MSPTAPPSSSGRILGKGEFYDDHSLSLCFAVVWTDNSKLPYSNWDSLSLDDISKPGATLIPKEHIYLVWREDITEVQNRYPDIFVKINRGVINYNGTSHLVNCPPSKIELLK
jgi:hypothetical protein